MLQLQNYISMKISLLFLDLIWKFIAKMGRFALIVVFWMKTDFCCQLVFSFQHWKPWGGGMVVHFEGFPNSSILLDFVWFRPCWLCLPEMRMGKRSTRCIICVSTKDAVTQMARSLQEEKTTSSQGAYASETITGTSGCCRGETTIRAESSVSCPSSSVESKIYTKCFYWQLQGTRWRTCTRGGSSL